MKALLGIILILIGIFIGLYVGLWLMFVGGILDGVQFIKQGLEPMGLLAWAIVKVTCASFVGWLSAIVFVATGHALVTDS